MVKRRAWRVLALAAVAATAFGGVAPAEADELALVDAGVTVSSIPSTVSPPGSAVIYRITVTNDGLLPIESATVRDSLPSGFVYRDNVSDARCSGAGTAVSCTVGPLASKAATVVDVVATTSTTPADYVNTASASIDGLTDALDTNRANNTASATTAVRTSDSATAFVPGGESLSFGSHVLKVPAKDSKGGDVLGVIVTLSKVNDATANCGGGPGSCGEGLNVLYGEDPKYQVTDADAPISVDTGFKHDPCLGYGAGKCTELYFRKPDATGKMSSPALVPNCDGFSGTSGPSNGSAKVGGVPQLCKHLVYKTSGGGIRQVVLMQSTDPDLLPPINL